MEAEAERRPRAAIGGIHKQHQSNLGKHRWFKQGCYDASQEPGQLMYSCRAHVTHVQHGDGRISGMQCRPMASFPLTCGCTLYICIEHGQRQLCPLPTQERACTLLLLLRLYIQVVFGRYPVRGSLFQCYVIGNVHLMSVLDDGGTVCVTWGLWVGVI